MIRFPGKLLRLHKSHTTTVWYVEIYIIFTVYSTEISMLDNNQQIPFGCHCSTPVTHFSCILTALIKSKLNEPLFS